MLPGMKFSVDWHFNNEVCELLPLKIEDLRGFFSEVYQKDNFEDLGISENFIQENHSFTKNKYTFRGLHFQKPPFEQAKLIRVLRGSILDIALDLRRNSSSYLEHKQFTLSANNFKQLFIPPGFAHGFQALEHENYIIYSCTKYRDKKSEVVIKFDEKNLKLIGLIKNL